jgi:hypothetical protein
MLPYEALPGELHRRNDLHHCTFRRQVDRLPTPRPQTQPIHERKLRSPGPPNAGASSWSASVGALSFVKLPASYSLQRNGCATSLVPDGLMVSSRKPSLRVPSPGQPQRAGASSFASVSDGECRMASRIRQLFGSLSTLGKGLRVFPAWRPVLTTPGPRGSPPRISAQTQVAVVRKNGQTALGREPLL